ncbi:type 4a pilus biogenesis protein PilO [Terribacillus sp. DMT04]|uniref:type 4a pilus biogenesis protein PilO n=1 Tax=Terribacillus sp. DMT04 TaxID=2850441 RepID=UPI001C2BBBFB|nr:type 4a pilus biogenesis protein PilO [Terribacillus sp. DMT04]QXE00560.1 type 4a pilus biogenesis protein PilO [Terribacillus sp. DMT04]
MINWSDASQRRKVMVFSFLLVILLTVMCFVLYVIPIKNDTASVETAVANQERVLGTSVAPKEQSQMPDAPLEDELLRKLTELAKANDTTITSISNDTTTESDGSFVYQLSITSSDYNALHQFLTEVDAMQRKAEIEQIDVTNASENSYIATISLRVFYNPAS